MIQNTNENFIVRRALASAGDPRLPWIVGEGFLCRKRRMCLQTSLSEIFTMYGIGLYNRELLSGEKEKTGIHCSRTTCRCLLQYIESRRIPSNVSVVIRFSPSAI